MSEQAARIRFNQRDLQNFEDHLSCVQNTSQPLKTIIFLSNKWLNKNIGIKWSKWIKHFLLIGMEYSPRRLLPRTCSLRSLWNLPHLPHHTLSIWLRWGYLLECWQWNPASSLATLLFFETFVWVSLLSIQFLRWENVASAVWRGSWCACRSDSLWQIACQASSPPPRKSTRPLPLMSMAKALPSTGRYLKPACSTA